jgi:uncharacterized protein (DUF58 family)
MRSWLEPGGFLYRLQHPRRTIWPTRDGGWSLLVAIGLGVAASLTGNNLLYLLDSLLFGLVIVSGILSEMVMRGLGLSSIEPEEIHAGRPAPFGAIVTNHKRWLTSYSVTVETLSPQARPRVLYLPRIGAGTDRLVTWEETLPTRGRHRLAGIRITTRFPFGLFLKAARPALTSDVVVFPAVHPISPELLRQLGASGHAPARRRGGGSDLYNLRGYRSGDDPRLIHWRSSAKTQSLTVRELEAETTEDTRLILLGTGTPGNPALEAALSEAASIATHLIRAGAGVELIGPGFFVRLGRGRPHLHRVLTALALYDPGASSGRAAESDDGEPGSLAPLRQIRVRLG